MRRLMLVMGALAGLAVIGTLLVDEGEIVILETHGADRIYTTQLWIVELDGVRYLRSGRSDTDWLARLQASPEVALRATDAPHVEASPYRALPVNDADLRERVNRAMAEKYGFSDVIWSWVVDRSGAVAIRLEPLAEQSASAEAGSVR